jgi:hypothetical protein
MARLAQLCQDAVAAFGVHERDSRPVGAIAWSLIDHPRPVGQQTGYRRFNILHLIRQVVDARAALFHELGYRTIRVGRLKELYLGFTYLEHGNPHLLFHDLLDTGEGHPEVIAVERKSVVERPHGNADVIDPGQHDNPL